MNGNLTLEQARELMAKHPLEDQMALIYTAVINQSHVCEQRPSECEGKYVSKSELKLRTIFLAGVCGGAGFSGLAGMARLLGLM